MNFTKRITSIFTLLFFTFSFTHAQNLQWAQRGGSAQSIGSADWEAADDMATDANGNVYVVTKSAVGTVNVAGQTKAEIGNRDVVLASFRCDGTLRWWHVIGTTYTDVAYQLQADKLDGVYLAMTAARSQQNSYVFKSDNDTLANVRTNQWMHLVKFDTSGTYKWFRTPEPDTLSFSGLGLSGGFEMNVDSAGNVYWLCLLTPGVYGGVGGYVVTTKNMHMLKYNKDGDFKGGFRIAVDNIDGQELGMSRNPRNGNFYFVNGAATVNSSLQINGVKVKSARYIACFDKDGNFQWIKEGKKDFEGFAGRPVIDKEDNIYIATTSAYTDTFQTYTYPFGVNMAGPLIVKLDKNGNLLWSHTSRGTVAFGRGGVALRNSGEVVFQIWATGNLKWYNAKDSMIIPSGYHSIVNRFNTHTGKFLGVEMPASAGNIAATRIVADARNNVFAGGYLTGSMTISGNTVNKVGGESDFYVYKYGYGTCNCTNIPEPNFNMVRDANNNVTFTYTGTTGISSYKWDFDDGDTATTATATHTYTKTGAITACVTVRNNCGDNTYCKSFYLFPTGIEGIVETENNIKVYPNPANDAVHIEGITAGTGIQLFDVTGRQVLQSASTSTNASINISSLSTGSYVLVLTSAEGTRTTRKLMKN